jgi:type IV pilus assembly protein PilE
LGSVLRRHQAGFNLIELMVVVVIIGILARIALPAYQSYVAGGQTTEATNTLSTMRAQMEQYYQDNRTYVGTTAIPSVCTNVSSAGGTNAGLKYFQVACSNVTATTYTLTATGNSGTPVNNFSYQIDNTNTKQSTAFGVTCTTTWKTSKSGGC